MRCFVKFLLVIQLVLILTGCWNYRDLTDISIATGIAIDMSEDGEYEITAQIVKPEALKSGENSGGKESKAYVNVTAKGKTMFDAFRNMLSSLNKKAYWAHLQLIVISEEVARDGLGDYFDLFERDAETRRRAYLIISKNMKAKTVLESESQLSKLPITHKVEGLETINQFSKSFKITLLDVLKNFNKEGFGIVLPTLYNDKQTEKIRQEEIKTEGAAVIKKGKLVGFLDPLQTRGYLFAIDKVKSTIINIPGPQNQGKLISIEIINSKGKINAKMKNGQPALSIEVEAKGNIGEQHEDDDLTKPGLFQVLEMEVKDKIEKEIQDAVRITQKEYQCDVYGFVDKIYKSDYKEWEKIVHEWDSIYSNTPVDIKVNFELKRPGLIKEPAKPE